MNQRFQKGSRVKLTHEAGENYGHAWQGVTLVVTHIATKYMPSEKYFAQGQPPGYHPGFDPAADCALYDLKIEATGDELSFSLYDWELTRA